VNNFTSDLKKERWLQESRGTELLPQIRTLDDLEVAAKVMRPPAENEPPALGEKPRRSTFPDDRHS
jgi:hypothetical protein